MEKNDTWHLLGLSRVQCDTEEHKNHVTSKLSF
jgi:hypothetical protein